jgi:hypothetical protein
MLAQRGTLPADERDTGGGPLGRSIEMLAILNAKGSSARQIYPLLSVRMLSIVRGMHMSAVETGKRKLDAFIFAGSLR